MTKKKYPLLTSLTSLNSLAHHRKQYSSYFQPLAYCLQHSFNLDVHADPLGTGASMAVCAAIYVNSLDANVGSAQAAVAPPLRGTKQAHYRSASRNGQMGWAGIAPNVNLCPLRELVETLQRKTDRMRFAGLTGPQRRVS